jgi:hypothetical protein
MIRKNQFSGVNSPQTPQDDQRIQLDGQVGSLPNQTQTGIAVDYLLSDVASGTSNGTVFVANSGK